MINAYVRCVNVLLYDLDLLKNTFWVSYMYEFKTSSLATQFVLTQSALQV